jgi:ATP-dependent exoDNAse (exonuclease V) beta subunit
VSRDIGHVRFISAGAGSGKTYRLTEELERALIEDGVAPRRVIGTTFTVKAAGELRERVRERLIRSGRPELAEQTAQALLGTVHSVCERLLKRFAFELGLSPDLHVASLEDCATLFRQALDAALATTDVRRMNEINARLDIRDDNKLQDWRDDVKSLVDRARDNDVGPEPLREMGRASAAALLAHFPRPENGKWDEALLAAVRDALHTIDVNLDTTIGTGKYVKELRAAIFRLRRPPCAWSTWISLSHAETTKRSEPIAAKVRAAASAYDKHPLFHADVKEYIENVYSIAAQTLARFQEIKKERGLIDFPDMEQLTLRALDEPAVRARLRAELELLLVDEFQDTNPMQLAIFMKLAALASKVIFVGDVKQAIYAFRGCDPDLVFDTLAGLAKGGSSADKLEHSWRSRPALVSYINAVFCEAFANEIPAEQVTLKPKRAEETLAPAVLHWPLAGSNNETRAKEVAQAIAALVASAHPVVDPQSRRVRPVRWGDIAVLATTNKNVERIALALRAAHLPMKMTLSGLFTVPETCLAKACLRRLNDATDTLATAEIIAMAECAEPELWLAERLQWLEHEDDGYAWAESTHPIAAKLKMLRAQIGTQSPVEIVARVLNYVGIREVVTAWGPNAIKAMQRQRNLDALLNLAVEYERHCEAQHLAATLTGFLFWLEHPHSPELDLQPVVTSGDAVHVLTYHRAKGLEWPVVVNTDFHYQWQSRVWDVRVESNGAPFDLHRPLANRVIRFWPRVFGNRTKGPVLESIFDSENGRTCQAKATSENRRLAYVGLTRARDCIVLALPVRNPPADAWLHAFAGRYLRPQNGILALPDGCTITIRTPEPSDESTSVPPAPFAPRRLPERTPIAAPMREGVNPSASVAFPGASVVETVELGDRMKLHSEDMTMIGTALHALIAAELLNPGRTLEDARALLAACCGSGFSRDSRDSDAFVDAESALAAAREFRAWLDRRFAPTRTLVEYPLVHVLEDGRAVRGWIDVLLETDLGFVVIDHKSSPRPKSEWQIEALEHSGQLAVYARALEAAGKKVAGCWIHFPVGGGAVAVDVRS